MKIQTSAAEVLDAEVEVSVLAETVEIVLHSKAGKSRSSPGSNLDYNDALELILFRLARLGVAIESVNLDSSVARRAPKAQRRLRLTYPINLSDTANIAQLRVQITESQRLVLSKVAAGSRGGNKHRRIRLTINTTHAPIPMEDFPAFIRAGEAAGNWPQQESLYVDPDQDPIVSEGRDVRFNAEAHRLARVTHNRLQAELSAHLIAHGTTPRGVADGEPPLDLSWNAGHQLVVAEVKSLKGSVSHQIRYGLGQVLDYRTRLRKIHHPTDVVAILALEFEPPSSYLELCDELSVRATWAPDWPNTLDLQ